VSATEYVICITGRSVASEYFVLAKYRYRSRALVASEFNTRPKFDAGLAIHSRTIVVIVQVLKPGALSTASMAYGVEISDCAIGTPL
jgi:hypothetical protein